MAEYSHAFASFLKCKQTILGDLRLSKTKRMKWNSFYSNSPDSLPLFLCLSLCFISDAQIFELFRFSLISCISSIESGIVITFLCFSSCRFHLSFSVKRTIREHILRDWVDHTCSVNGLVSQVSIQCWSGDLFLNAFKHRNEKNKNDPIGQLKTEKHITSETITINK